MKKTVTINLNSLMFHIDEDAYETLQTYLTTLGTHFKKEDNSAEIIHDIEARISELFQIKKTHENQVITIEDVQEVISIMGKPEDFDIASESTQQQQKRLFRDTDNRVLGGVCSGISHYFNIDVVIVRILFLCTIFFAGPLIYILAWILIPKAQTTTEKAEMLWDNYDIENIKRKVKQEIDEIRSHYSEYEHEIKNKFSHKKKRVKKHNHTLLSPFFSGLRYMLRAVFYVLIASGIIVLFLYLTNISIDFREAHSFEQFVSSLNSFSDYLFTSDSYKRYSFTALVLLSIIPGFLIIMGIGLLIGAIQSIKFTEHLLFLIWLVAIILGIIGFSHLVSNFSEKETIETNYTYEADSSKSYTISVITDLQKQNKPKIHLPHNSIIQASPHNTWKIYQKVDYKIEYTEEKNIGIEIQTTSHGETEKIAKELAFNLASKVQITKDSITFPEYIELSKPKKWRNQHIHISISIPKDIEYSHHKIQKTN
ncbi:MAG: PspC domain-containing protein [Bacteroidales bacterium]|jgi:phage shock protein PspC (stress-responsive transcriptional regulator)|nr:PspC domain-containing protein [Bacteroidales bacterium]